MVPVFALGEPFLLHLEVLSELLVLLHHVAWSLLLLLNALLRCSLLLGLEDCALHLGTLLEDQTLLWVHQLAMKTA